MTFMNTSAFFDFVDNMSVKELDRIKKHIEKVIEAKKPSDRKFIGSLNIDDFVSYSPNYLNEDDISRITHELYACDKFVNSDNATTKSMWLSTTALPYKWTSYSTGNITVKEANPMGDFKFINLLLENINDCLGTTLNSCLIQYYPNGGSGIRLHDDFEWEMDHSQPFVNVSIGCCRKIEFFHNYQKASETPAKVVLVQNGSMYTMNKGCQKFFRHRVPSMGSSTGARFNLSFRCILDFKKVPIGSSRDFISGCETPVKESMPAEAKAPICFSPRTLPSIPKKLAPQIFSPKVPSAPPSETSPIASDLAPSAPREEVSPDAPPAIPSAPRFEAPLTSSPKFPSIHPSAPPLEASTSYSQTALPPTAPPIELFSSGQTVPLSVAHGNTADNRDVTVLFGTSITRHLDPEFISNRNTEFINVSVSGAKLKNTSRYSSIPDIATMVRDFADSQPSKVHRVNRVVFSCGTNDIKFLKSKQLGPLRENLCNLIHLARQVFGYGVDILFQSVLPMRVMYSYTVENFLNFNRLLQNVCCGYGCRYIDWFHYFLDSNGDDINDIFYADPIHLNRRGIATLNKFMSQLCKFRAVYRSRLT